jgi:hypothetical protein
MMDDRHGHDAANADDGASVDETALSTVETLMAERRKYESWLETLEARRQSTPERVFTRVHGDYHDRLDAVIQQLKEHTEGLRAELASLTSRLSSLDNEQQQRRDERAEAELRAHVGELSPDAWRDIANESDKAIDALTSRHGELERERLRTRELLNEAERPPTPRDAVPVVAPPKQPAAPAVANAPAPEPARPPVEQPPVELPPPVVAAEAKLTEPAAPDRTDADVTPRPMPRADASRGAEKKPGGFDELAFLSSVVNTPAGTADVPPSGERGDDRIENAAPQGEIVNTANEPGTLLQAGAARGAASPLAMNVSGNNPLIIKDKMTETAKTLKCAECGAMNYPTEWYCERCGAELASL